MSDRSPMPCRDLGILNGLLILLLFVSPVVSWIGRAGLPWYAPYCLWGLVILLALASALRCGRHEP